MNRSRRPDMSILRRGAMTWNQLAGQRGFLIGMLVLGVALIFGTPLLAQHDEEPAGETHAAGEAPGTEAEHGEMIGHGDSGEHVEGEHEEGGAVHPPTLISIMADLAEGHSVHTAADATNPVARFLLIYKAPIYSFFVILLLGTVFGLGARNLTMVPGGFQNFLEWVIEGLSGFIGGVLGPDGVRFVPFLGTLFLYIYIQNVLGIIPLMFTSTSMVETTAAMALVVFVYVQFTAVRMNGPVGYLLHLAGDPKDVVGWCMAPLMLPLHLVGELAKPLSLSLRLFGNMMGEETLLAVFMGLGVTVLAFTHLPVGFPFHVPFVFLGLLTTLIQALVFTLLSTIYFALVLPHHEEEGAH